MNSICRLPSALVDTRFVYSSTTTGIISRIVYAVEAEDAIEKFSDVVEEMMSSTDSASKPGGILVDVFPICGLSIQ